MTVPQAFKEVMLTKEGTKTFTVLGHKIPLLDIQESLLKEDESKTFMRIWHDSDFDLVTEDEISSRLKQLDQDKEEDRLPKSKDKLKEIECKRHLMVWDNNSTLLNYGHILQSVLYMMVNFTTLMKK